MVGGQTALSPTLFSYDAPVISSIAIPPYVASHPCARADSAWDRHSDGDDWPLVNCSGKNFGQAENKALIFVGKRPCTDCQLLAAGAGGDSGMARLSCRVPPGGGANLSVAVTVGGQRSLPAPLKFSYHAPVVRRSRAAGDKRILTCSACSLGAVCALPVCWRRRHCCHHRAHRARAALWHRRQHHRRGVSLERWLGLISCRSDRRGSIGAGLCRQVQWISAQEVQVSSPLGAAAT